MFHITLVYTYVHRHITGEYNVVWSVTAYLTVVDDSLDVGINAVSSE